MIHRYCVTHAMPLLPEGWYGQWIALGDFDQDSEFHVKQLDRFWHEARPIAFGAAGTHVLPIVIEKFSADADLIEVSSYRKRVLPVRLGTESRIYPTMRELRLGDTTATADLAAFTPVDNLEFLVAQPLHIKKTVVGHYGLVHHRRDILDYASLAIETGVLDADSAAEFLAAEHFIPCGIELGIYPKSWLKRTWSKIELVGRQFLIRHGDRVKKYNRYQVRAVGFLGERLGSYLLIRHLKEKYANEIPGGVFGYMTTVVTDDSGYSAGLSERSRSRLGRGSSI
ncbi:hypothetical protein [Mycobacterium vicinigordonae]|uniref:Uncharacterized protein n=1 Tax=Mycobacterium vicinigordonae TaxID=1719132 RepID=A0A7D6IMJ9_9MYCO|nr:hypothetical protein [Mycobacterium vicinigordonae]QLL07800.1 hypothetical protein H0P51_01980 [Mycobacterium vicinigordonae]